MPPVTGAPAAIPLTALAGHVEVGHGGIEGCHVALGVGPAGHDFIAQSQVDRQVGFHLPVVLNEQLRGFPSSAVLRCIVGAPLLRLAEQEVCIGETVKRGGVAAALRRCRLPAKVMPAEVMLPQAVESARLIRNSPPKCRTCLPLISVSHVGWVEDHFLVDRVGAGDNVAVEAADGQVAA